MLSILLDLDFPLLVQRYPTGIQNSRGENGVLDRGQAMSIIVGSLGRAGVDASSRLDELVDRDVSVSTLTVKVTGFRGRVLHVEGVVRGFACCVSPVSLTVRMQAFGVVEENVPLASSVT